MDDFEDKQDLTPIPGNAGTVGVSGVVGVAGNRDRESAFAGKDRRGAFGEEEEEEEEESVGRGRGRGRGGRGEEERSLLLEEGKRKWETETWKSLRPLSTENLDDAVVSSESTPPSQEL